MELSNHLKAAIDRQLRAREEYTRTGRNAPPALQCKAIAERHNVPVKEVQARLRARGEG